MSNKIEEKIREEIINRVNARLGKVPEEICDYLSKYMPGGLMYVAGGFCNPGVPNDMDIYPINDKMATFNTMARSEDNGFSFCYDSGDEKNTLSFSYRRKIYQICRYIKPSLKDLVDSFDFAHIQVGCLVDVGYPLRVKDVYFTDDYVVSRTIGRSYYTGTEYPLSSLIRAFKYASRDELGNRKDISNTVLSILSDIIDRGYSSYDDFKDQLASIDLLLKKDIDEPVLKKFVTSLLKRKIADKADRRFVAVAGGDIEEAETAGDEEDGNAGTEIDSEVSGKDSATRKAPEDPQLPF